MLKKKPKLRHICKGSFGFETSSSFADKPFGLAKLGPKIKIIGCVFQF